LTDELKKKKQRGGNGSRTSWNHGIRVATFGTLLRPKKKRFHDNSITVEDGHQKIKSNSWMRQKY